MMAQEHCIAARELQHGDADLRCGPEDEPLDLIIEH